MYKKILPFIFLITTAAHMMVSAQDSVGRKSVPIFISHALTDSESRATVAPRRPFVKPWLVPSVLISYGIASLESNKLKGVNEELKEEVWIENVHRPVHLDNYLQYVPGAMVYGLNIIGIKGKNNFRDRTIIFGMANIIMGSTVTITKELTHEWRPDGSDRLSFPSGHTATAFAAAEFLWQEYGDVSVWYGVAGYAIAGATGYLRMYNNKHWLGDVLAGAGVGILSTKLAYWIYPVIKRKLFKNKSVSTFVVPFFQKGSSDLALVHHFKN